jgi:hypothetical protein
VAWEEAPSSLPPSSAQETPEFYVPSSLRQGLDTTREAPVQKNKLSELSGFADDIIGDAFFAPILEKRKRDNYGDSLKHVNKLLNKEFGNSARRVPAHMPHFLDTEIIKYTFFLILARLFLRKSLQKYSSPYFFSKSIK